MNFRNNRFMYTGSKIILFDDKPIPNYRKAFENGNHHDMRGAVVKATAEFMRVTPGMLGIVHETYQDFDSDYEH